MEDLLFKRRVEHMGVSLKILSALLVILGVCLLTVVLFMVDGQTLELVAEEILMPEATVMAVTVLLLLLVVASGLVSLYRIRYGWIAVFFVASLVLLMGLLLGTRTILLTRVSFFVMMILSLITWANAVVYYFWDLYT